MRLGLFKRGGDLANSFSTSTSRTVIDFRQVRQDLRRRQEGRDVQNDCDSSDDENGGGASPTSAQSTIAKSACSRVRLSPAGIQVPASAPSLDLPNSVLPLSVSAFPAMATVPAFTGTTIVVPTTTTTLSLSTPATTSTVVPASTQDSGSGAPQTSETHRSLSPRAQDALIAVGIIVGIAILGIALFIAFRCLKRRRRRRRGEVPATADPETVYRAEPSAPSSMSESSVTIAPPQTAYMACSSPNHKYQLPPIFRYSQRSWSWSLYRRSKSSTASVEEHNPFADEEAYPDPGRLLHPQHIAKAVTRKKVGGGAGGIDSGERVGENPFRDPEKNGDEDEEEERFENASVSSGEFHTTPSWVDDQAVRAASRL